MKPIYHAIHHSLHTQVEMDLVDNGDLSDYRITVSAGLQSIGIIFSSSLRSLTTSLATSDKLGRWDIFKCSVSRHDIIHWITSDGVAIPLKYEYVGKVET